MINSLLKNVNNLNKKDGLAKKTDDDLKKKMKILFILLVFSWVFYHHIGHNKVY